MYCEPPFEPLDHGADGESPSWYYNKDPDDHFRCSDSRIATIHRLEIPVFAYCQIHYSGSDISTSLDDPLLDYRREFSIHIHWHDLYHGFEAELLLISLDTERLLREGLGWAEATEEKGRDHFSCMPYSLVPEPRDEDRGPYKGTLTFLMKDKEPRGLWHAKLAVAGRRATGWQGVVAVQDLLVEEMIQDELIHWDRAVRMASAERDEGRPVTRGEIPYRWMGAEELKHVTSRLDGLGIDDRADGGAGMRHIRDGLAEMNVNIMPDDKVYIHIDTDDEQQVLENVDDPDMD